MARQRMVMSVLELLMLLMTSLLRCGRSQDSSQADYTGVIADEVPLEYHPGMVLGGFPEWSGSDWSVLTGSVGGRLNQARCVDIPANMTLCHGIGYAQMRLPNLLEHDSIHEATQQAASWVPLLNIRCHADTRMFLCSLFAPICLDRPIYPCRTLCEAVQAGCESRMRNYGFPWPEMLRCDKFPVDNDLCIGVQHHAEEHDDTCAACAHPDTFESVIDSFCTAEFAIKIRSGRKVTSGSDIQLIAGKKKVFKKSGLRKSDLRGRKSFYVENGAHCRCEALQGHPGNEAEADGRRRRRGSGEWYLVMGRKRDDRLIVSFVRSLDRQRSRSLTRALRSMRRQTTALCQRDGISAAFASAAPPYRAPSQPNTADRSGRKNGNRRRRKEKDGGRKEASASRGDNEMTKRGRRSRKNKRRQSTPEIETETETT